MDTSKEYIKMCEKAVEIRRLAQWKEGDCIWADGIHWLTYEMYKVKEVQEIIYFMMTKDISLLDNTHCMAEKVTIGRGEYSLNRYYKPIWLPRQDQLQEMVWDCLSKFCTDKMDNLAWCLWSQYNKMEDVDSMEKLWLSVTMKEKFKKKWNGEDWTNY
jgi:hypothetical protein